MVIEATDLVETIEIEEEIEDMEEIDEAMEEIDQTIDTTGKKSEILF